MTARRITAALLLAWAVPAAAAPADDFAARVRIDPVAGASLQQVMVPAAVLAASRSAGLADLRVFDGAGKAVPAALAVTPVAGRRETVALPVLPIISAADKLAVTGVSLRIEGPDQARVVRVDGTPQAGGGVTVGVLLDARRITAAVAGVTLDVAMPARQLVTFTIERSRDLKTWVPLAEEVIYRTGEAAGTETLAFAARSVRGDYLRIGWRAASRLLSPVTVRGAGLVTVGDGDGAPVPRAVLAVTPSPDSHVIELRLPFATPAAALEIVAGAGDVVVPVRILGRDDREHPWVPITSGRVFRLSEAGRQRRNPPFDLHDTRFRLLRIEADARTAGFTTPPRLAVRFAPVRLLFLAAGPPPFTLAAGQAGARSTLLAESDLLPPGGVGDAAPPLATKAALADPVVSADMAEAGAPWRRIALWGILILATIFLGAMVWRLSRRHDRPA